MTRQEFYDILVARYLSNTATDEEMELFFGLLERGELEHALEKQLDQQYEPTPVQPSEQRTIRPARKNGYRRMAAAAIVIILFTAGYYLLKSDILSPSSNESSVLTAIPPGTNKASLTLADGRTVDLSSDKEGIVVGTDDVRYTDGSRVAAIQTTDADYTITTPRGGQYQINLPDGTRVWLNAASVLTYPSRFSDDKREVKLNGEAYFDVNHQSDAPFVVRTAEQEVTVLGTEFNISAYADERETKTTLVNGSVMVSMPVSGSGSHSLRLARGEQSSIAAGVLTKRTVDPGSAIAWKNGKFLFEREDIASIMRKVARWYDVEVVYADDVSGLTFTGSLSRFDDISKILDKIAYTRTVRFKIDHATTDGKGRRVIVMK
ncbi:FecR domain-containing protein [Parapedobacter defluvii]|uniref:FecR family protein n=1 Tax=Parapedobacter defluvii TaxID=2045106 RepID=UPI00333E62E1